MCAEEVVQGWELGQDSTVCALDIRLCRCADSCRHMTTAAPHGTPCLTCCSRAMRMLWWRKEAACTRWEDRQAKQYTGAQLAAYVWHQRPPAVRSWATIHVAVRTHVTPCQSQPVCTSPSFLLGSEVAGWFAKWYMLAVSTRQHHLVP
jgi:hypothetical protein